MIRTKERLIEIRSKRTRPKRKQLNYVLEITKFKRKLAMMQLIKAMSELKRWAGLCPEFHLRGSLCHKVNCDNTGLIALLNLVISIV